MNAVIYARYSTDNQREESIEGQIRECKEYAERNGIKIISNYIDRALSAKTDNRPEFQKMIKDSSKKIFDAVIVWKLDRFSRNRYDSAHYKAVLRKNGVRVISATENLGEGPEAIILESMLEGYAEYYSAELSVKINRGLKENALKAKYNGGSCPLGFYIDEEQHYNIAPNEAPIVREIFQRYASGEPVVSITKSLNSRGLRSKKGKEFNKNSLRAMLRNRKYLGEYHYQDVTIPHAIPALIEQQLFDKVQIRMKKNRQAPARLREDVLIEYILTSKLFCGECGASMIGESGTGKGGKKYRYYKCTKARKEKSCKEKPIKKDWIEREVIKATTQIIFNDQLIDKIADMMVSMQKKEDPMVESLRHQLSETERSIEHLLNAIQQGILTSSTKQRLDDLEKAKASIEAELIRRESINPIYSKKDIVAWIQQFRNGTSDDINYQKMLIDIFVCSVHVFKDRLIFVFNCCHENETPATRSEIFSSLKNSTPPKIPAPIFNGWRVFFY